MNYSDDPSLPGGLRYRPPEMGDMAAVVGLIAACDVADTGAPDISLSDVQADWQRPGFDLAADAGLLVTPDGQAVGYWDVWRRSNEVFITPCIVVHPDYRGLGLEERQLEQAEARARELLTAAPAGEVKALAGVARAASPTATLFERSGYAIVKYTWRMQIDLDGPPPLPAWPGGYTLRSFRPEEDAYAVYRVIEDAFSVFPHRQPVSFELWRKWVIERPDFDPQLAFVVTQREDAAPVAGAAIGFDYPDEALGWVRQLAVAERHRRRGLALALLYHAFGVFYGRGHRSVGLGVDAANPTGATRLYERAGMRAVAEFVSYRKELA